MKGLELKEKLNIMLRNWSHSVFRNILYEEARNTNRHRYRSVYQRLYMYLRILELGWKPYKELQEILVREIGDAPSSTQITWWLKGRQSPLGKIKVFDVFQPKVGFIIGAVLSDGDKGISKHKGQVCDYYVKLNNKDRAFIEEFKEACHELGLTYQERTETSGLGKELIKVKVRSTLLYLLIKHYKIFITEAPDSLQRNFLRGITLGDGYIGQKIYLYNTDLELLKTIGTLLTKLGIKWTLQGPYKPAKTLGKKPRYRINICKTSWQHFLKAINP